MRKGNTVKLIGCLFVAAILLVSLVACNGNQSSGEVALLNWADEVESILQGSKYNVKVLEAKDVNGNVYPVSAHAYGADGAEILLIANEFIADNLDGYSIQYHARITENDVRIKTVKLTVFDLSDVFFSIEGDDIDFFEGEEVLLPTVSLNKIDGGQAVGGGVLYVLTDSLGNSIEIGSNHSVQLAKGNYYLKATIEYRGATLTQAVPIIVQRAPYARRNRTLRTRVRNRSDYQQQRSYDQAVAREL